MNSSKNEIDKIGAIYSELIGKLRALAGTPITSEHMVGQVFELVGDVPSFNDIMEIYDDVDELFSECVYYYDYFAPYNRAITENETISPEDLKCYFAGMKKHLAIINQVRVRLLSTA